MRTSIVNTMYVFGVALMFVGALLATENNVLADPPVYAPCGAACITSACAESKGTNCVSASSCNAVAGCNCACIGAPPTCRCVGPVIIGK